jgi:hypothetical protein
MFDLRFMPNTASRAMIKLKHLKGYRHQELDSKGAGLGYTCHDGEFSLPTESFKH